MDVGEAFIHNHRVVVRSFVNQNEFQQARLKILKNNIFSTLIVQRDIYKK